MTLIGVAVAVIGGLIAAGLIVGAVMNWQVHRAADRVLEAMSWEWQAGRDLSNQLGICSAVFYNATVVLIDEGWIEIEFRAGALGIKTAHYRRKRSGSRRRNSRVFNSVLVATQPRASA